MLLIVFVTLFSQIQRIGYFPLQIQIHHFFQTKEGLPIIAPVFVNNTDIPFVNCVRFLGVLLDDKFDEKQTVHLKILINKGFNVTKIIISLVGTWWGAHPSLLLSLYRAVVQESHWVWTPIFNLNKNRTLFVKVQRQQYRIIGAFLEMRQSIPINILLCETREPSLSLRFAFGRHNSIIFSDSRSVLDVLSSPSGKSCTNFLILTIKGKFLSMNKAGFWSNASEFHRTPAYPGMKGWIHWRNLQRFTAVSLNSRLRIRISIPFLRVIWEKAFLAFLINEFRIKGTVYYLNFFKSSSKTWFSHLSLSRSQITTMYI